MFHPLTRNFAVHSENDTTSEAVFITESRIDPPLPRTHNELVAPVSLLSKFLLQGHGRFKKTGIHLTAYLKWLTTPSRSSPPQV
ncbi:hypothetical protein AV530_006620 [Patagioenas fasciata monilis]|uniref:Uncharacterized protein n=1 Tax=Patagioenas fasciata monilis TaxID=372326 RepID=A0A1V4KHA7_PATFA|nr:hypothetical protein AV530_006620 [Patagioenas fasciata monilis]